MNKKTLVTLVKKEASNLKKRALKKERRLLDFKELNPSSALSCIYGQMTGCCWSTRANQLISNCAERVYNNPVSDLTCGVLNGKPKITSSGDRSKHYFSPIECFICFDGNKKNGNNEKLIDYLKGKTKTLRFKKF